MRRVSATFLVSVIAIAAGIAGSMTATQAQSKPAPGFSDYGKWESLGAAGGGGRGGGGGGGLSNDGKWLAYSISKSNRESELRLLNLGTNALTTEKFGSGLQFSEDTKWAVWSLGYSEAEQERMRTQQRPIQNRLVIMNLASGDKTTLDAIQSFTFSSDGRF